METSGISSGSNLAQTAQKASGDNAPANNAPAANSDQSYLSKLEVLGSDHPLTKFLGGFWSQNVDVEA
jgi:hypothetical protein